MAAFLPILAMGLKFVGAAQEGLAHDAAGRANKRAMDRNALMTERAGVAQIARSRQDARQAIGRQLASQGASGFQMGTGSAADLIQQGQMEAALEALTIRANAQSEADSLRYRGAIAKAEGRNRMIGSFFGAASSLAGSVSDYANAGGAG